MVASPPDNTTTSVICDLNSGGASSLTMSQQEAHSDSSISATNEDSSPAGATSPDEGTVSSDETWTSSIDDKDSQGNDDDVVESMPWQESPMKQSNFEINFDTVDQDLEHGDFQETKQIRKRILYEYNTICLDNKKPSPRLNAVEIFNAIYTVAVLLPVL
jgi:hypothetical protein